MRSNPGRVHLAEVRPETPVTVELIRYAHVVIFADLYGWAGRWRTVKISKPGVTWSPPDFLEKAMADFDADVLRLYPARELVADDAFCRAVGHIQGELLAIRPFREGNARTIKLATNLLVVQAGHLPLRDDMTDAGRQAYIEAAKAAILGIYDPMVAVIRTALAATR